MPKIIHCFWSEGPKTGLAEKCLASWQKYAPDYEIREWNLSNLSDFATRLPAFVSAAIAARKWAFVSDWARFAALKEYGGIYFDFDVELVKPIDMLPDGEWVAGEWTVSGRVGMNPGSGIALEKDSPIAQAMLSYYYETSFGEELTVGEILEGLAGSPNCRILKLQVLPPEVLSPIAVNGAVRRTENTIGIHWYAMSWASPMRRLARWLSWHGFHWAVIRAVRIKRKLFRLKAN